MLFSFAFANMASAAGEQVLISSGNNAYAAGRYQEAADTYNKVYSQGLESPELYYNLGNCYFKLGDMPRAILWYERAKRLDPGNDDVNFNLNVANSRITDKIEPLPEFFLKRWIRSFISILSTDAWAYYGLGLFVISLVLLGLYIASRILFVRKLGFWAGFSLLFVSLIFLLFSWISYRAVITDQSAIVISPTVTVKSSPDEKSTDIFVIHEGCKIQLIDHIGLWFEIRIANGSVGWMRQDDFEKI